MSSPPSSAAPVQREALLTDLPGVGPARATALAAIGVRSVRQLLLLTPVRVRESAALLPIAQALLRRGQEVRIAGRVTKLGLQRFGGRSTLRVLLEDASGSIPAVYFNQPWMRKRFVVGEDFVLEGRVAELRGAVLTSPCIGTSEKPLPKLGELRLSYPEVEGLGAQFLAKLCRQAARQHAALLAEHVDRATLARLGLPALPQAVRELHEPPDTQRFAAAQRRVQLELLFALQARARARRAARALGHALACPIDARELALFVARFPFPFTAGQERIASELATDLARAAPMRRLVQGDVGSGKTWLGVLASLIVARAGGQTAFLAPTELLVEQHFNGQRALLARAGLHAVLLTGSLRSSERAQVLAQIESGMADVVFGTHALFTGSVRYRRLALAVIDEQQRFGVGQRAELLDKGLDVHALLLSATPIPRTLALSLYGDLDTSILSERPAGRGSVRTHWVRGQKRAAVPKFLAERLAAGERVYWVTPRIGEEEDGDSVLATGQASAEAAFARLSRTPLAAHGIELVHGRLPADERARRLERFRRGEVQLLVATTVIEVGVDVPEATVMVIESAERLGLAQLHQLRGRIGRGQKDSWCLLFGERSASERFEVLERTHDGFEIAEEDLRRRGMGDLAGVRQTGVDALGQADLSESVDLLAAARDLVATNDELYAAYRAGAGAFTP